MKKTAILLIAILLFLGTMFWAFGFSNAQTFDSNRAYQDYLYAQNTYNQNYSSYQAAKDFYLKTKP